MMSEILPPVPPASRLRAWATTIASGINAGAMSGATVEERFQLRALSLDLAKMADDMEAASGARRA